MKQLIIVLSILLFPFTASYGSPVDRLGVKGPLVFNKMNFKLSWTDKPNDNYYIQEYLPEGEKTESYNQMMTIHLFITDLTIEEAVGQRVKQLDARKKTDKICNYQVNESPDGKEFMIDFLMGESKGDEMTVVEFNAYHYKQIELGNKKKAIIVYAYTRRSYGDDISNFLKTISEDRIIYLNEMISIEIPNVSVENK